GSAVAMGTILMAGAIPRAVLMLMGGVLTDRVSPRKIMMATASARTACVTMIGVLVWLRLVHTWELYALAVAFGVADAFAAPAAPTSKKAMWQSIIEGIQYVRNDVPLRSLMLLATGMNFCLAGPVTVGLAYVTKTKFDSPAALGIVFSAVAAGSLLGALLAGVWKIRRR